MDTKGKDDLQRHAHVSERLARQPENAREWRQVCIDYFCQSMEGTHSAASKM